MAAPAPTTAQETILTLCRANRPLKEIAATLNAEGVPPPSGRRWTRAAVRAVATANGVNVSRPGRKPGMPGTRQPRRETPPEPPAPPPAPAPASAERYAGASGINEPACHPAWKALLATVARF